MAVGALAVLGAPTVSGATTPTTIYAAPAAQGTGDCSSVSDACALTTALTDVVAGGTIDLVTAGVDAYYSGGFSISTAGTSSSAPVTIQPAPGVSDPTLDGGSTDQVLAVGDMYLDLDGLTIQNGRSASGGGIALGAGGHLAVTSSSFLHNDAFSSSPSGDGGAIDSGDGGSGTVTVTDSTFQYDVSGNDGGAIDSGDHSGGSGTLTVSDSTFSNISAAENGGAIDSGDHGATGTVTMSDSTVSSASAPNGGAVNDGDNNGTGTLTLTDSTMSGNSAYDGGAIDVGDNAGGGTATVTGSTLWQNLSGHDGGTIDMGDELGHGTVTVAADVFAGGSCDQVSGTWTDHGYNVGSDTTCFNGGTGDDDSAGSNLPSLLALPAQNGGPTETQAPLPGNPAIGNIPDPTAGLCPVAADQRGVASAAGAACDAGAVQLDVKGPAVYTAVTPYRICDTRGTNGLSGTDAQCAGHTLAAGGTLTIQVSGTDPTGTSSGGVPDTGIAAVVLNVTATGEAGHGYLTVWPSDATQPAASNLNYQPDKAVPNLVTVGLSARGQVSLYSLASTDVVVDVEGYYYAAPSGTTGLFDSLTPYRICDTRGTDGLSGTDAQCAGHTLSGGGTLTLQVTATNPTGTGSGGVPATGVSAVVLNVTAIGHGTGYVTAFPQGVTAPTASNLNFSSGQVVPNRVIVPVGASGQVSLTSNTSVDVVVDVNGWFTDGSSPSQTGARFVATTPSRICDTRSNGNATPCAGHTLIGPAASLAIAVAGQGPVPSSGVVAVVANITATDTTAQSYLTAWPTGQSQPTASDLNWVSGLSVPNMAVVGLGTGGDISVYVNGGNADVIVDVDGWYVNTT